MTPFEILDFIGQLVNIGASGILLFLLWNLWIAYQELIRHVLEIKESVTNNETQDEDETEPRPPWDY